MSEREFWKFVWLAGVRLPFIFPCGLFERVRLSAWGCTQLIVARYTGWNLAKGRWCWDR